jgi:hypothetical protein
MRQRTSTDRPPRQRVINQRTFEVDASGDTESHLMYFIKQELGYYNTLVEQLTPRLRAFPQEFMSLKEKEKKLWESCAENAVDPSKLVEHKVEAWPENLRYLQPLVLNPDGTPRITTAQVGLIKVAAEPARLHPIVRRNMAAEVMRYMIGQSETLHAGMKTEGLRSPMQMLQTHTLETKRHLQIPASLVKMSYDEPNNQTVINVPYSKEPMRCNGYDLTEIPFKTMIIRAPHPGTGERKWYMDLRDTGSYMLNAVDHNDQRRRK